MHATPASSVRSHVSRSRWHQVVGTCSRCWSAGVIFAVLSATFVALDLRPSKTSVAR